MRLGGGATIDHQATQRQGLGICGVDDCSPFFPAGLVDGADGLILDCYRLAKYYHRNPEEFLNLPFSQLMRHRLWTSKLLERQEEAEDDG